MNIDDIIQSSEPGGEEDEETKKNQVRPKKA
jgi:hypothetical protein